MTVRVDPRRRADRHAVRPLAIDVEGVVLEELLAAIEDLGTAIVPAGTYPRAGELAISAT